MHNKLFVTVALLAIGTTSAACRKTPTETLQEMRETSGDVVSPTGGGHNTTNSLLPHTYWCNQSTLEAHMQAPLAPGAAKELVSAFDSILKFTDGEKLIQYGVECAVDDTITFPSKKVFTAPTGRLLKDTADWTTTGIKAPEHRQELHTCIATRLNPTAQSVDIWLGGDAIESDGSTAPSIPEAIWLTDRDVDGKLTIHIWPFKIIADSTCNDGFANALNLRVCGSNPDRCNIKQHPSSEIGTVCKQTGPASWQCSLETGSMRPAIVTYIGCDAFCSLYPHCTAPPALKCPLEACKLTPVPVLKCP